MTTSLLLRTFRQLPAKDLRALREWIRCGCFNRRAEVTRLCDHLCDHIHKPAQKNLTAEQLHAAAFPEATGYDNRALRHVMSYLLEAVRQYLAWVEWSADATEQQQTLVRALRRRGMEHLFGKEWDWAHSEAEQSNVRDARYHFQQYQLHQERVEQTARSKRSGRLNLQPLPDQLTIYYVAEMLRHACLAHMHRAVAGQVYRLDLLNTILEAAGQEEMLRVPAVALYYHAYQMLQSPDEPEPFERLKSALVEHEARFAAEEMRGLYLMAINGCIRRMNAGQRQYIREAFDLYRAALQRDFLTENGFLSGFTYKNIIRAGVALGEHAWTEDFLEQQRTRLHPRERDNLYRYNLAFLRFRQQDYACAMPLLQQVDFEDPLNNLDARRMLLRSYFEMKEWDALESLLQSFGAYLRRQKNLGYHRTTNEHLILFTKKLMELDRCDAAAVDALRTEIATAPEVAEREWLVAQC